MPSKTSKQARFMAMACKDPKFAKENHISQEVACEFHEADKQKALAEKLKRSATRKRNQSKRDHRKKKP